MFHFCNLMKNSQYHIFELIFVIQFSPKLWYNCCLYHGISYIAGIISILLLITTTAPKPHVTNTPHPPPFESIQNFTRYPLLRSPHSIGEDLLFVQPQMDGRIERFSAISLSSSAKSILAISIFLKLQPQIVGQNHITPCCLIYV